MVPLCVREIFFPTHILIIIIIIIIITLFKCQIYLALRHTYWGYCKLKLIQIELNQMQGFEKRGKPSTLGKTSLTI